MVYKYKTSVSAAKKALAESHKFKGGGPKICNNRMYRKKCDYCLKVAELYSSGNEADKELAGKVRFKSTYYVNMLDLNDVPAGVQVYGFGIEIFRNMMDILSDPEESLDFTDASKPHAVIINRTGKGRSTKYTLKCSIKPLKAVPDKFLKLMHPLHNVVKLLEDGLEPWKPSEGSNRLLVFPPWGKEAVDETGQSIFWYETFWHWNTNLLQMDEENIGGEDGFEGDETEIGGEEGFEDTSVEDDGFAEDDSGFEEGGEEEILPDMEGWNRNQLLAFMKKHKLPIKGYAKLPPKRLKEAIEEAYLEASPSSDMGDDIPY